MVRLNVNKGKISTSQSLSLFNTKEETTPNLTPERVGLGLERRNRVVEGKDLLLAILTESSPARATECRH